MIFVDVIESYVSPGDCYAGYWDVTDRADPHDPPGLGAAGRPPVPLPGAQYTTSIVCKEPCIFTSLVIFFVSEIPHSMLTLGAENEIIENFHPLEVVSRYSDSQLQVVENCGICIYLYYLVRFFRFCRWY